MAYLNHTEIYRSGKTSTIRKFETKKCTFEVDIDSNTLELRFEIKSKGTGYTDVQVEIGMEALPQMLKAITKAKPEIAEVLLDCAVLANKKNLAKERKAKKCVEMKAKRASKKLDDVTKSVWEISNRVPVGEREIEVEILTKLAEAGQLLDGLNPM